MRAALTALILVVSPSGAIAQAPDTVARVEAEPGVNFTTLEALTVDALRERRFGSTLEVEADLSKWPVAAAYSEKYFATGPAPYLSFIASYRSDGLRLYTRIDIPKTPPPKKGYPVIIFMHGWVGYEAAKEFHFSYTPASMYADMVDAYAKAGFVVLTPGYRGHGTVGGVVADGRASMAAWDNATHISPILYAIDTLNLIDGLGSIEKIDWLKWGMKARRVPVDLSRLSISGHSQGGDAALAVLAISGKGSKVVNRPVNGSIISGTFADRFTQVETFRPMAESAQAFLAGDGRWNGSAVGSDGSVNPHFVFGWPSDAIADPDPDSLKKQKPELFQKSVRQVIEAGYGEMYDRFRAQVGDLANVRFSVAENQSPKGYEIVHDPRVRSIMSRIGGFRRHELISARISLHFPDRDYYSLPQWNRDLCVRITSAGGQCAAYEYPGNTHGLRLSPNGWFTPPGSHEGYRLIIDRDLAKFK